ncbi:CDP-diacylglycerol--inositol 3-phosphatidyltransferase [Carpediemonas membranifera]|uniref:CDP-diacylglycerol--inositol 3-phosphatidyltransferase n=1 Tax=Carpediemonas membranifera TaxID=201153 RepID=A0A8J6AR56_9EUKA|nr:CDP-diacylglycerol--inositol 3-phosphatidyltransferase [Carpediemonas membranifera]|eukprot:KAG9390065.1 CDP-diacylglycerol--inositol 3-phosphatidyltransferase [Carpediemonas membranifera]
MVVDQPSNSPQSKRATPVLLYWPNLIGYARIITAFISFYLMPTRPVAALWYYSLSLLADGIDGYAARLFNQSSRFGACLDMVTDRFSTTCLCVVLARMCPDLTLLLQLIVALDISSHYIQMYTSLALGKVSHKDVGTSKGIMNTLMRLYYTSRPVLWTLCFGNEAFLLGLYMLYWFPENAFYRIVWVISVPLFAFKQFMNAVQLGTACGSLIEEDTKGKAGKSA